LRRKARLTQLKKVSPSKQEVSRGHSSYPGNEGPNVKPCLFEIHKTRERTEASEYREIDKFMNAIFSTKFWKKKGLVSLTDTYNKARQDLPTTVYGSVRTVV
jgi:hypothetical protein